MAIIRVVFVLLVSSPLLAGCASHRIHSLTGRELVELDEKWAKATAANDLNAAMDFWTEHAVMYVPDAEPIYGRQAIRDFLAAHNGSSANTIRWTPCCAGIDDGGSMAYTLGEGTFSAGSANSKPVHVRYLAVWHKDQGRWRCAVKCWTTTRNQGLKP